MNIHTLPGRFHTTPTMVLYSTIIYTVQHKPVCTHSHKQMVHGCQCSHCQSPDQTLQVMFDFFFMSELIKMCHESIQSLHTMDVQRQQYCPTKAECNNYRSGEVVKQTQRLIILLNTSKKILVWLLSSVSVSICASNSNICVEINMVHELTVFLSSPSWIDVEARMQ